MKKVYLDNAATTPMAPEVVAAMVPVMKEEFGNPSSTHGFGRRTRSLIERSRRSIAKHLNAQASEIYFTSGGTEADNMALMCSVRDLGVKRIITSPIEHHAVLHTAEYLAESNQAQLELVDINEYGEVNLQDLEAKLKASDLPTLVSLMHANNEVGTMINLHEVGDICKKYNAYFHSDTVQSMAHYSFDLKNTPVDFITGAGHKFNGPKGVGFLYIRKDVNINPLIHGGAQERNMRGGTENVYGIVGLAAAMDSAYAHIEDHESAIKGLKSTMIQGLKEAIPEIHFNGTSGEVDKSLYTVLSCCFPKTEFSDFLLINLDILGIAASGGSACSSGSNIGSHVLAALKGNTDTRPTVRFSFGRYTSPEDIDYTLEKIKELYLQEMAK